MTPEPTLEQRTNVPVPAILDLWSLGHSANKIAEMLGTKRRAVSLIIEQARDIGDPRAAIHVGKSGRAIGRPAKDIDPDVEAVPAIPISVCRRGHPRTPENLDGDSSCRICKRAKKRALYAASRA